MNTKYTKKGMLLLMLTASLSLTGCSLTGKQQVSSNDASSYIFTMGTVFEIRSIAADSETIIKDIESALYTCDHLISWREEGSLAADFNTTHQTDMSAIKEVLSDAIEVSKDSQGAFDLTILPLSELWQFDQMSESDFDVDEMVVPSQAAIDEALTHVDYSKLSFDAASGILTSADDTLLIELGAIGKGYGIKEALKVLKASDASGGMISAGSSIGVYGAKEDGTAFKVALRDPRGEADDYIGVISATDTTISTSGDYERYFEKDGIRYHHIIDPHTGYPADSGLMQVTIICEDSVIGDALSTACFVLGLEKGMALAEKYGVLAIFVDTDKNIWYNNSDVLNMLDFSGEKSGYVLNGYN